MNQELANIQMEPTRPALGAIMSARRGSLGALGSDGGTDAVVNYIYDGQGNPVGFWRDRYVYTLNGNPVGQLNGTHVHKLAGDYIGELLQDMVVDKHMGNFGNIGHPGHPGNPGNPGHPGNRGAMNYGYRDVFNELLS